MYWRYYRDSKYQRERKERIKGVNRKKRRWFV